MDRRITINYLIGMFLIVGIKQFLFAIALHLQLIFGQYGICPCFSWKEEYKITGISLLLIIVK